MDVWTNVCIEKAIELEQAAQETKNKTDFSYIQKKTGKKSQDEE